MADATGWINRKSPQLKNWEIFPQLSKPLQLGNKTLDLYQLLDVDIERRSFHAPAEPPVLWEDKMPAMAAVEKNGLNLQFVSEELQNDREVVLKAIAQNRNAIQYSPRYYWSAQHVFRANPTEAEWQVFLTLYKESLQTYFQPAEYTNQPTMLATIKKRYNIGFPSRFLFAATFFNLIDQRSLTVNPDDQRPLAVLVYPKSDRNGAFTSYPVAERLMELGYRVYYDEAETDEGAIKILEAATAGGKMKARVVILAGHGTSDALQLGATVLHSVLALTEKRKFLDTVDVISNKIDFNKYISPNGDLLLYSCSNGSGREQNLDNLANTIAEHTHDIVIHASDAPMALKSLDAIDENGLPRLKVTWTINSYYSPKPNPQR